ncbi:MAG: COX15/CtaA family protein [Actinomycetota bacterium]|nr:COX15/CtaA family protein [Actinomycetota bacterium]
MSFSHRSEPAAGSQARGGTAEPSPTAFRAAAVATTVAALVLVAVGGAVRATDSGLACPDWPKCYGLWIPPADLNIWLEHSHRLIAGVVGLMTLGLALWTAGRHRRADLLWPALGALVLVTAQAGLGALVVLHLLRADLVTAHLGMAMAVVACLIYLSVNATVPRLPRDQRAARDLRFPRANAAVAGLTYLQILVGGHVTGIGAGLAFGLEGFPLFGGSVVPPIGSEREAFHVAHRFLAFALAGAVLWLCALAARHRGRLVADGLWSARHRWLVRLPMLAATLVAVQIILGVANIAGQLSFVTVIPHLAVASWIWALLVLCTTLAYRLAPERDLRIATGDEPDLLEAMPAAGVGDGS